MFTCGIINAHAIRRDGLSCIIIFLFIIHNYSLVILIYFLSIGKELRKVEQQTQVDKKQQQFGTDVASILS